MSAMEEIVVPNLGDVGEVPVIEILVKPGAAVEVGDPLVVLETDKATMEVPAPLAGTVDRILIAVGDKVKVGTPLLTMERVPGDPIPPADREPIVDVAPAPSAGPRASEPPPMSRERGRPAESPAEASRDSEGFPPHASPSVRRFAREIGVDLGQVPGSGRHGRILREDVQREVKTRLQAPATDGHPAPRVDFSDYGDVERVPLSRVRQISGAVLARNWAAIPHVTNFHEADVTSLEEFRGGLNQSADGTDAKVTMLAFLMKACAATLARFPEFNASLDGDHLILKRYVHVGFAADTPNGLMVPVIRDADKKGVAAIAGELAHLAAQARAGKLKAGDMQGGSFSISSLGGIGGGGFTPIINAPEVAILGAARTRMQPVWDGERFQPRLMLPLCLSWDHRAVDGAAAGRFLVHLAGLLEDFWSLVLRLA